MRILFHSSISSGDRAPSLVHGLKTPSFGSLLFPINTYSGASIPFVWAMRKKLRKEGPWSKQTMNTEIGM